eukprot:gene2944-1191_t
MAEQGGIDLREIVRKTGHQIEEIRLRALENILSKLRNQIIFIEDLVHHRELIVNLMQWFNYENPQKVVEVLQLIENLSKHGAAASILQSVGAIEFFSMMRQDLEDKEHLEHIDSILNSIFWVQAERRDEHIDHNSLTEENSFYATSVIQDGSSKINKVINQSMKSTENKSVHSNLSTLANSVPKDDSKTQLSANSVKWTRKTPDIQGTKEEDVDTGSSVVSSEWIVLTSSDRHILSVTETRLQSHSIEIVSQSCEFFKDVLLQDFPSHIFIQRPNLVKTLLGLLESYAIKDEDVVAMLLGCLNQLTLELYKSSLQETNPDLLQISKINEVYSSTESSVHTEISSLHSRTTSLNEVGTPVEATSSTDRDFKSNGDSDADEFESELLTEALQQTQWSILDYCLEVISSAISLSLFSVQSAKRCDDVILFLNNTLDVLSLCKVDSIWNGNNDRKVYDVMTCLRHISDLIQLCLETKDHFVSQLEAATDIASIFSFLANSVAISIRFVNLCVPPERVFEAVPESLLACFKKICADEILSQYYPAIRNSLLAILRNAEENFYENFKLAASVISSMKTVKGFVEEAKNMESSSSPKLIKLLDICRGSLPSVGFHRCEAFISSSLRLVSLLYKSRDQPDDVMRNAKDTLLRLLAHENEQVRAIAYQSCLEIVTGAMSDSHVTNPLSTAYKHALLLIDTDVLYEIAAFGLESTNKKIKNYAANILVALLFGRLNMPAQVWQSLIHSISPTLPVLQCFASADKALERGLAAIADATNTMLTADGRSYLLPPLEQLRASLRFMFVKNEHIRARGFSSVIWTLTQEDNKEGKPARYRHEAVENAADMFLVGPVLSSKYQQAGTIPTGFAGSKLEHLWDVFVSESLEESLRESAAEQLAILAQDTSLHKQLLDQDADKILVAKLHSQIRKIGSYSSVPATPGLKMIVSCVTILKHIVQHNSTIRHALAVDKSLYLDIFKCRLIFHEVESVHFETSCLIAYLVFDEVIKGKNNSLPALVAKRYALPLDLPTYEISTEHREKPCYLTTDQMHILRDEPFSSMIRISWNVIEAGGPANVQVESSSECLRNSSQALKLTDNEAKLLKDGLPHALMNKNSEILKKSENLGMIIKAIKELKKEIMAIICQLNAYPCTGRKDFFSMHYADFFATVQDPNLFKRLYQILDKKTSSLHYLFKFCQLLNMIDTKLSLATTADILRPLLQYGGDPTGVISGYVLLRTQQTETSRSEGETYDLKNEDRSLFKSILALVSLLSIKLNAGDGSQQLHGIGDFILLVVQSLSRVGSTSYYDLPVLEITLDCLSHITYRKGWSLQFAGSGEELCNLMADLFIQILHSFHVDRTGVSTSFMGKGVITKVATCLCHVAMETQAFCKDKDWTASWILQDNAQTFDGVLENTLPWLLPLLTDRSLDIRWCGWALSTALLNGSAGAESVVNEFQIYPGGVWASAVGVILDNHENSLIRSQACKLIVTSLSKLKRSKESTSYDFWENMVVQDTQSQTNITGFPAFLLLLDHFNFFSKIKDILIWESATKHASTLQSAYQNVSTSCSSQRSDTDQDYERISDCSHDDESSDSVPTSVTASNTKSSITEDAKGSSSECLLLSSIDSLSDSSQHHQSVFRFSVSKQEERTVLRTIDNRGQCSSTKLRSSLFQLIGMLAECDAENVILSLQTNGLLEMITRFMDAGFVAKYTTRLSQSTPKTSNLAQSFLENAELAGNILKVVNLLISNHKAFALKLQGDVQFSSQLMSLFEIDAEFTSSSSLASQALYKVWNEALRLLIKICSRDQSMEQMKIEAYVIKNLSLVAVSYYQVVSAGKLAKSTVSLFLLLFSCIFGRESRRKCNHRTVPQALEGGSELLSFCKQSKEFHEKAAFTLGEFFCKIFLDQLNRSMSIGQDKKTVLSALSLLFVLSTSSKQFALENGFLESTMEDVKDIHVKLNLASLQFEKEGAHKRKEKSLLLVVAEIFGLLRNLLHSSTDTKNAAVKSGLLMSIQKMWSWCLIEKQLKLAILEILCTLSSNCPKAQLTSCLLKGLGTESIWTRAMVVTCFASLLRNCHKAKVALKRTNLLAKLQLMNEEVISGSFDTQ